MWKKFLAVLAISGLIASSTAFAVQANPEPANPPAVGAIQNFSVSPTTFNPTNNEEVKVSFNLAQAMDVYAYVVSPTGQIVTTFANFKPTAAGNVGYPWLGKVGNTANGAVLAEGKYTVKVFTSVQGAIKDAKTADVTIGSVGSGPQDPDAPSISNLKAVPGTFNAQADEDTDISFEVSKGAYITVQVKNGNTVVQTFPEYDGDQFYNSTENHSINWDGRDKNGAVVADGSYTVEVTAKNEEGQNTATTSVKVSKTCPISSGVIEDFCTDPSQTWDPTDEELQIEFELTSDVRSLSIEAKKGNQVVEILDDDFADDGDYEETWDGTDDDGDYVDEGVWTITLRADGDKVVKTIEVDYEQPEFADAFVTKTSFDPGEDEFTNLVFKVDTASEVTVEVFQGSKRQATLLDEESVRKNKWYAVQWDGIDEDGDEVDFGKEWKFKITAENETDQKIESVETIEFDVEEDNVSDKKSNVTNDYTVPVIHDEDGNSMVSLYYTIDEEADVFVAIYEGMSSTGNEEVELLDYVSQDAGSHVIDWNVTDDKGKDLKDGIYTFKIISRTDGGHKDTEIGRFVVGNAGTTGGGQGPDEVECNDGVDNDGDGYIDYYGTPSVGYDLGCSSPDDDSEEGEVAACNDGIDNDGDGYIDYYGTNYAGYDLGCDSPEDNDEYDDMTPPSSDCGGYTDTQRVAANNYEMCQAIEWVTSMGIFNGYADGSFGPYNNINRAEVLKVVMQAFPDVVILPKDGSNHGFADLDPDAWYMPYVRTAKFYGMLHGYPDGTAKLDRNINRVEFLKFVLEAAEEFNGYSIPKAQYSEFADVNFSAPEQQWFQDYAGVAWTMYLFSTQYDYKSGEQFLRPGDLVQRGEVALVLYRLYQNGVLGWDGYTMSETPVYNDNMMYSGQPAVYPYYPY